MTISLHLCGLPKEYDVTIKSDDGCPHCGSDDLYPMHGLAAGGIGSYILCFTCDKIFNFVPDEGGEPRT